MINIIVFILVSPFIIATTFVGKIVRWWKGENCNCKMS